VDIIQEQIAALHKNDRCYCGSQVIDGELKLVACDFHKAANTMTKMNRVVEAAKEAIGVMYPVTGAQNHWHDELEVALADLKVTDRNLAKEIPGGSYSGIYPLPERDLDCGVITRGRTRLMTKDEIWHRRMQGWWMHGDMVFDGLHFDEDDPLWIVGGELYLKTVPMTKEEIIERRFEAEMQHRHGRNLLYYHLASRTVSVGNPDLMVRIFHYPDEVR